MKIPFVNLSDCNVDSYDTIMTKIEKLIKNTQFIGGHEVSAFETEFADFCRVPYAIGCGNGTEALMVALHTLGIGAGDTVLVPANTFIATSEAVTMVGAKVAFIDIDPVHYTIDANKIREYLASDLGASVKAVVPVHLYGQMADMSEIMKIAQEYNLKVVEDSSQAHGALIDHKGPGEWGDMATFSFYPSKNLGAFGDAGAVITKDKELYQKCKALVNHGLQAGAKYEHSMEGFNFRLDTLQAAVLRIKLKNLRKWTTERVKKAEYYQEQLSNISGIRLPSIRSNAEAVWHLFVIEVENRDALKTKLEEKGISTIIHYPIPLHLQPAYSYLGYTQKSFPFAEDASTKILSLPLWPEMTREQQDYVINHLKNEV